MQRAIAVSIPEGWRFSDLRLHRNPDTGDVSFDVEALRAVLPEPADLEWLLGHREDYLADLLARLYRYAVEHLGAEDPTVERMIAEIRDEHTAE